jgi:hypothetical protein
MKIEIYKDKDCTSYTRRCVVRNGKQYGFAHRCENDPFDPKEDWSVYSTNEYDLTADNWEQIV